MSDRTLKWIIGVLAVLVAAWAGVTFLSRRSSAPPGQAKVAAFFQGLTPAAVSAVQILGPEDTVHLSQRGGRWSVNGLPTDSEALSEFWAAVRKASVVELTASNPANQAPLGVAADSTWKLTFDVAGASRTIYVGKPGRATLNFYARLPDDSAVYTLGGGLRAEVQRTPDDWRDHQVTRVDTSAVVHIVVKKGRTTYHLVREDSTWKFLKGGKADSSAVRGILTELVSLRANGFYHSGDSLTAEAGSITALSGTGDTLTAVTVGSGEGNRWARARGDSTIYRIGGYRAERMMPDRKTLEPEKK